MKGFFKKSEMLAMGKKPASLAPRCELCRLYKSCVSPKMPPTGGNRLGVLIVAEAPSEIDDEQNKHQVSSMGLLLRKTLGEIGVDLDNDCVVTNAIICRPSENQTSKKRFKVTSNRTPTSDEMSYCRPHLTKTIEKYTPQVIIPLGDIAFKQLTKPWWEKGYGVFERWVGRQIPLQPLNVWVCPVVHPWFINRDKNVVQDLLFKQHLEAAFKLTKKPWKDGPPDYQSMVEIVDDAESAIREMKDYVGMAAFDYEANMLKPDSSEALVVSSSITWGKGRAERCIAYAMTPSNTTATRKWLRSPIPKIGANIKFESRWSMAQLKTKIRNWCWDTMQCAHVLDNMPGVTSNDFLSFTVLGLPSYSSHISPLLKSKQKGGSTMNQILSEIDLPQLLVYNGMDTITEFEIAVRQMKRLGRKPPWKD